MFKLLCTRRDIFYSVTKLNVETNDSVRPLLSLSMLIKRRSLYIFLQKKCWCLGIATKSSYLELIPIMVVVTRTRNLARVVMPRLLLYTKRNKNSLNKKYKKTIKCTFIFGKMQQKNIPTS